MLDMSAELKSAFKSSLRRIYAKAIFYYDEVLEIAGEHIISLKIDNTAPIGLGGIQDDVLDIELVKDSISETQFNQVVDVGVYIGAQVNDTIEYVYLGKYVSNYWKKNDSTGVITIELVNKINQNAIIPRNIVQVAGKSVSEYMESVVLETYSEALEVANNVTVQIIEKSWLCYEKIYDQLNKMAEACNSLLINKDGFKLIAYRKTTSIGDLKIGMNEELYSVTRISDYSDYKQQVSILKSGFVSSTMEKLASATVNLLDDSQVIEIKTTGAISVAFVICGNVYSQLVGIETGVNWCNVEIYPVYSTGVPHSSPVEIWGSKVQSVLKDNKVVTDGSITYIENPYIQTVDNVGYLDKRIYEGVRYKLEYCGNPLYEVGDTINVDGYGTMLIYKRTLDFKGGLSGTLEGVLIDG